MFSALKIKKKSHLTFSIKSLFIINITKQKELWIATRPDFRESSRPTAQNSSLNPPNREPLYRKRRTRLENLLVPPRTLGGTTAACWRSNSPQTCKKSRVESNSAFLLTDIFRFLLHSIQKIINFSLVYQIDITNMNSITTTTTTTPHQNW